MLTAPMTPLNPASAGDGYGLKLKAVRRALRAIQNAYRDLYVTTLKAGKAAELKEEAAE